MCHKQDPLKQVCTDAAVCWSRPTDGAVPTLNWVHLLLTGSARVEQEQAEGDGSATARDNLERDIKVDPAVCTSVCLPFAGAHHPERGELFTPAQTLEPRSGLHCDTDPTAPGKVDVDSRGREKIACTHVHMQTRQ